MLPFIAAGFPLIFTVDAHLELIAPSLLSVLPKNAALAIK
jgi:hypothetical protein